MKDRKESEEGIGRREMCYTNQFDLSKVIQVASTPMVNGIIPLNNQTVNDFNDLALLDGIKFAYDLCVEENLKLPRRLCPIMKGKEYER